MDKTVKLQENKKEAKTALLRNFCLLNKNFKTYI